MSSAEPALTNGHAPSANTSQHVDAIVTPPEIEATLSRLAAYRNVRGVMILSRSHPAAASSSASAGQAASTLVPDGIVQSTGAVFEGESGKTYAAALHSVVEGVTRAVGECDPGVRRAETQEKSSADSQDELKFMRVRTKRHELIITPGELHSM